MSDKLTFSVSQCISCLQVSCDYLIFLGDCLPALLLLTDLTAKFNKSWVLILLVEFLLISIRSRTSNFSHTTPQCYIDKVLELVSLSDISNSNQFSCQHHKLRNALPTSLHLTTSFHHNQLPSCLWLISYSFSNFSVNHHHLSFNCFTTTLTWLFFFFFFFKPKDLYQRNIED